MLKRTSDNRLLFINQRQSCELLPFVSPAFLQDLKKELLLIEQLYFCEVFGACPFLFLSRPQYQVLRLIEKHWSLPKIARQLNLPLKTVTLIFTQLQSQYRLWAHDSNFKVHPDQATLKIRLEASNFSDLIQDDDFESLADLLPSDNGWEAARAWSQIEALDVLALLTPAQKQTAIFLEQGYSPAEIAQKMGVSTQEIYQKIARMRRTLSQAGYAGQLRPHSSTSPPVDQQSN